MKRLPKFAYLPFSGGPRVCIGSAFAMMEGVLVLAAIARKYRVRLAPDQQIVPWPVFTLRPRHGIKLVLEKKQAPAREVSSSLAYAGQLDRLQYRLVRFEFWTA
jgi:hypothetical protein